MPILRLVVIYLVLALAVVAVFNRDKLGRLVFGDPPAEVAAASAQPMAPAQPVAPAPASPAPAPPPAPGQPAPGVLQTPQPTPAAPVPAASPAPQAAPDRAVEPDLAEALNAARSAYWSGDIAGAGDRLAALAAAHPDNPDLHGELGNFRFANRDYAGAADAYLRAGELLIAEGRQGQASGLLPVLRQIAPDKAQTLATRLQLR
jgi:TolA-binding protein